MTCKPNLKPLKITGMIFLVSLIISAVIFWGFLSQAHNSATLTLKSNEQLRINLLEKTLENNIEVNAYNLVALANHMNHHRWITTRKLNDRAEMVHHFEDVSRHSNLYHKLRYIDMQGNELIRVDYNMGQPEDIQLDRLQNKAHRYYFKETVQLEPNQIYVSPFDLNKDYGQVTKPLTPVIRFAMPVYRQNGFKDGILILNYLGSMLIKQLEKATSGGTGNLLLLNSDGFGLSVLEPEEKWVGELSEKMSNKLSVSDPEAWQEIVKQPMGQFETGKGLYSYSSIQLDKIGLINPHGSDSAFSTDGSFYWKVISFISNDQLTSLHHTIVIRFLKYYAFVIGILLFLSWWFALLIEQRMMAQKKIDANQAALESVFRSVPAGIGMDLDRTITQANAQLCKMTGYSKEELVGEKTRILYTSDKEYEHVGTQKYQQIEKDGTGSIETQWRCKNGDIIDILLSTAPVNPNRLSDGLTFSAFDITDRKKAEIKLNDSEKRYRMIVESSGDGILTVSTDFKLTSMNRAIETIVNQTRQEWIGKNYLALICPEDKDTAKRLFQKVADTGDVVTRELKVQTKDPEICRICEFKLHPKFDDHHGISGIIVFAKDITEYKKSQENLERTAFLLRQAQKMEAIGTLAGGIAHDFNNILCGILGYAQLTEINLDDAEKARENAKQITKAAERASGLVEQILTFSRQTTLERKPLKISLALKEALILIRASIPSTIEIKKGKFSSASVLADPTQIHQIIMNLCTNAYQAMSDNGGLLTVNLDEVELSETSIVENFDVLPGRYLKLAVSDTGSGIDKQTMEKIFDPYFTTKGPGKGTGLGLSLVQALAKEHNGFIEVYSEPGKGSCFYVYLPVFKESFPLKAPIKDKKISCFRGTENIMIVDDEQTIRSIFEELFRYYGYQVVSYQDGISAFEAFEANPNWPDLVITDLTMPKMTGDKLAAKILALRPDLPIILCTGYNQQFSSEKAAELGIKKFIYKPIDSENIIKMVRHQLDRRMRLGEKNL